jgi:cold shock CspA family protein
MDGVIVQLETDKGFGWLLGSDGVRRFFHRTAVTGCSFDELQEQLQIRFEDDASTTRGPRARSVFVDARHPR